MYTGKEPGDVVDTLQVVSSVRRRKIDICGLFNRDQEANGYPQHSDRNNYEPGYPSC